MTIKGMYNVGVITIGTVQKNLFSGSADGVPFLFKRNGTGFDYVTADQVRTQMALQLAVIDSRLDLNAVDNTAVPTYTTAATVNNPYRSVAIANANDLMTENYNGAPYYTLKGDGVLEYTATDLMYATSQYGLMNAEAAPTTPTGIAAVDGVIKFAMDNILWIVLAIVGLAYLGVFDPFGLFKKKGKKAKK